jgi:hypothetical protein
MICLEANLIVFSICIIPLSQVFSYSVYAGSLVFPPPALKNKIDFESPLQVRGPQTRVEDTIFYLEAHEETSRTTQSYFLKNFFVHFVVKHCWLQAKQQQQREISVCFVV